jgi:uncharacterized protein (TIGR02246 family)
MPGGARDDADRAAIRRVTSEILAAVNASDRGRLLAVWADDGVLMPPNRPAVQGRDALERHFREVFAERRFRFSFTLGDVELAGDVAFERLAYAASAWPTGGGPAVDDAGKGLHVYRRQPDGGWKLVLDIWNSDGRSPT